MIKNRKSYVDSCSHVLHFSFDFANYSLYPLFGCRVTLPVATVNNELENLITRHSQKYFDTSGYNEFDA